MKKSPLLFMTWVHLGVIVASATIPGQLWVASLGLAAALAVPFWLVFAFLTVATLRRTARGIGGARGPRSPMHSAPDAPGESRFHPCRQACMASPVRRPTCLQTVL